MPRSLVPGINTSDAADRLGPEGMCTCPSLFHQFNYSGRRQFHFPNSRPGDSSIQATRHAPGVQRSTSHITTTNPSFCGRTRARSRAPVPLGVRVSFCHQRMIFGGWPWLSPLAEDRLSTALSKHKFSRHHHFLPPHACPIHVNLPEFAASTWRQGLGSSQHRGLGRTHIIPLPTRQLTWRMHPLV